MSAYAISYNNSQVEKSDKTTKICENCFSKIQDYARFRDICAATDASMEKANQPCDEVTGDLFHEFIEEFEVDANATNSTILQNRSSSRNPINEYISQIGDENGSKIDQTHAELEHEAVSSSNAKSDVMDRQRVDVSSGASQMYARPNPRFK